MEAREIKFRAWDGVRMRGTGKNDWFSLRSDGMLSFGQADDPKVHLMQYTGLKDKNGTGSTYLFEGDIIDASGNIIGSLYESPQILRDGANHAIAKMGTKSWRESESIAMGRGYGYAE